MGNRRREKTGGGGVRWREGGTVSGCEVAAETGPALKRSGKLATWPGTWRRPFSFSLRALRHDQRCSRKWRCQRALLLLCVELGKAESRPSVSKLVDACRLMVENGAAGGVGEVSGVKSWRAGRRAVEMRASFAVLQCIGHSHDEEDAEHVRT